MISLHFPPLSCKHSCRLPLFILLGASQACAALASGDGCGQEQVPSPHLPRTVHFSGYDWEVRASSEPETPDYNYFSDSDDNVWVDGSGKLHLRITRRDSKWYCSEVVLTSSLGHGIYIFQLESDLAGLDRNVVLGLFHYDYRDTDPFHREMDIEFSRWGVADGPNAQFVLQPWESEGNLHRWVMPPGIVSSTHSYYWATDSIQFTSSEGYQSAPPFESVIERWTFGRSCSVPQPGQERVRVNLWLSLARPPSDSAEPEVVLASFKHIPEPWVRRRRASALPVHRLLQNEPNPFNTETTIAYELNAPLEVRVRIHDTSGRLIRRLVAETRTPGVYELVWDGSDESGTPAPSGIYICCTEAGETRTAVQMVLVR